VNTTTAIQANRTAAIKAIYVRINLLDEYTDNASVRACIEDALDCIIAAVDGTPFPGTSVTPQPLWIEAATKWVNRAGQHAFGFALPVGW
jgi:hypothetical protein